MSGVNTAVKCEVDDNDDYSNSSESSGPVDLSEGALRVFTELEPQQRRGEKHSAAPSSSTTAAAGQPGQNQVIEVMVDGKIQIFEIQPVEASLNEEGMISYSTADSEAMTGQYSSAGTVGTGEPEYINLDTSTSHANMSSWPATNASMDCSIDQISSTTPNYYPDIAPGQRYTGPIEISYPANVLYPPPPSEMAGADNHNILIQRAPTRGNRKEGKTGANR